MDPYLTTEEPNIFTRTRRTLNAIVQSFSPTEKVLFTIIALVFSLSAFVVMGQVNEEALVRIPASGGSVVEGVLGPPRFINPLLSVTDADKDLVALLYSGLMKVQPDGSLIPDLAEQYTVSEDGLTYTFTIRQNATFHDGTPVTARDVAFTINKAQDPLLKSPLRASWDGIIVEEIGRQEVRFTLELPYAPFLQNTTLGILPAHKWDAADAEQFALSEFNSEPIGSGPYKIETIARNRSGITEAYVLEPFTDYVLGTPYVEQIELRFYTNENDLVDAYINGQVDAVNNLSKNGLALIALNKDELRIERSALPRIFGIFFNQNQANVLSHQEVREALNISLDKKRIVNEVLGGNGTVIEGPIPPGIVDIPLATSSSDETVSRTKQAIELLEANQWRVNEETGLWQKKTKDGTEAITFSLATSDVSELKQVVQIIKDEWGKLGVPVDIEIYSPGDLNQNVIRPRKYDALFFGEIVGRELDLFAFWHSSQRNDPGLNIALYANITTDALLENIRTSTDSSELLTMYVDLQREIISDAPAVFVYVPDFTYIVPTQLEGIHINSITDPSERFLNVHEWFIETDRVWSIFDSA